MALPQRPRGNITLPRQTETEFILQGSSRINTNLPSIIDPEDDALLNIDDNPSSTLQLKMAADLIELIDIAFNAQSEDKTMRLFVAKALLQKVKNKTGMETMLPGWEVYLDYKNKPSRIKGAEITNELRNLIKKMVKHHKTNIYEYGGLAMLEELNRRGAI